MPLRGCERGEMAGSSAAPGDADSAHSRRDVVECTGEVAGVDRAFCREGGVHLDGLADYR